VTAPRILLVEDEPLLARGAGRRLESQYGSRVWSASSIEEARSWLRSLRQNAAALDGAIVDLGLPDGSGFDVARELRSERPILPTMVLTGSLGSGVVERARSLGALYVLKPPQDCHFRGFMAEVVRARARYRAPSALDRVVEAYRERYDLREPEVATLEQTVDGLDRSKIPRALGISEEAFKRHADELLAKTGQRSLASLGVTVVCDALGRS
jgi:DNA-binding NarL/FixJ family response regulator